LSPWGQWIGHRKRRVAEIKGKNYIIGVKPTVMENGSNAIAKGETIAYKNISSGIERYNSTFILFLPCAMMVKIKNSIGLAQMRILIKDH
jgi:hypothetical protein